MDDRPKKLLDQVRDTIRLKHYSYRTEQTYVQRIRRFILFHNKRHPQEMAKASEVRWIAKNHQTLTIVYLHLCEQEVSVYDSSTG
jgi:Phage integrase, N-terminal SAM-like domain